MRRDLEAFLSTHKDRQLRSATPGFTEDAGMPAACGWGEAVGCLRQNANLFADLNLKVRRGPVDRVLTNGGGGVTQE